MRVTPSDWSLEVDGKAVGSGAVPDPDRISSFFEGNTQTISIGRFIGVADDIHVRAISQ